MISIQKRFLFIHVPKTGGNSIQNILKDYSEDKIVTIDPHQDGVERFEVRNHKYFTTKHSTLSYYQSVIEADLYRSLLKFATLRNPWEMMISFYFSPHRKTEKWNRNEFCDLVRDVPTLRYYTCQNAPENPLQNLDSDIDYLMRFEQLQNDFDRVCKQLGLPHCPLPRRNRSSHAHYSTYYDDDLKDIVRSKFAEEIEFGNYRFETI
jgi:hypothetical protein